jgi:hypothetical protein
MTSEPMAAEATPLRPYSSGYRTAEPRQLKLLKEGFDLGTKGQIGFKRDELHERR